MRSPSVVRVLTALSFFVCLASWPVIADEEDLETPAALPEAKGQEEVFYACTGCHSTAIIRQQGMTRENWTSSLDWMRERHGMAELDQETRDLVLDYLVAQFPPRRRGPINPFIDPPPR